MKDIFIDTNIAKNFANPADSHYKTLIGWLMDYDKELVDNDPTQKVNFAHLIVNQKLLTEYLSSAKNCFQATSIPVIINKLISQGRLIKLENNQINSLKQQFIPPKIEKKLLSNTEDHAHICTIIYSNRKMALSCDQNLTKDLQNFSGYNIIVSNRPENINYK